jgi:hypothetical protein
MRSPERLTMQDRIAMGVTEGEEGQIARRKEPQSTTRHCEN